MGVPGMSQALDRLARHTVSTNCCWMAHLWPLEANRGYIMTMTPARGIPRLALLLAAALAFARLESGACGSLGSSPSHSQTIVELVIDAPPADWAGEVLPSVGASPCRGAASVSSRTAYARLLAELWLRVRFDCAVRRALSTLCCTARSWHRASAYLPRDSLASTSGDDPLPST